MLLKYFKLRKLIYNIFNEQHFKDSLGRLFKREFKIDWLGRIYCIINPLVDNMEEELYSNKLIFEYDENGKAVYDTFIYNYFIIKLQALNLFFRDNMLLDIMSLEIRKIDDDQNYLVIFNPIILNSLKKRIKYWSIGILTSLLIGGIILFLV